MVKHIFSIIEPLVSHIPIDLCTECWNICQSHCPVRQPVRLVGKSVIIQVVIYNCSLSLRGHLETPLLAKGGEGIVDVKLTPLHRGPQGAKTWRRPRDVDVVVVVRWRVRVGVWGDGWLLLLGRGRAPRCPRPRGDSAGGGRHLVVCSVAKARATKGAHFTVLNVAFIKFNQLHFLTCRSRGLQQKYTNQYRYAKSVWARMQHAWPTLLKQTDSLKNEFNSCYFSGMTWKGSQK